VAVVVVLCVALCIPARADNLKTTGEAVVALAIVGVAAVVVVAVVVIHHSTKTRSITGCVNSANNAMTLTDEKDKQVYLLGGDTASVKPGERLTLQGKKVNSSGSPKLTWETKKIAKDLGACQP
jgi:hypothetical protein